MAESRKLYTDADYLANYDGEAGADVVDLGYYQRTNLEDIINNFIVAYIGPDKMLTNVPRHEVAFWAQRTVQEFSYDTFHADKKIEIEVNPDTMQMPLPQDFVKLVKLVKVDDRGNEHEIIRSPDTTAGTAILQDNEYIYEYDMAGQELYAEVSEALKKYQEEDGSINETYLRSYYLGSNYDGDYDQFSYSFNQGRRYGLNPQRTNSFITYVIDLNQGVIYFNSLLSEIDGQTLIGLTYISDGLADNGDLTAVYVPKLAEDAVYASMLYNLMKVRATTAQAAPIYKKEASAKMRNAKIRLQGYNWKEMTTVMRNKSKWIKH